MAPNLKKLGPKTLAVLLGVAAINTALSYYVLEQVVRPAFHSLESREAERNMERVRFALDKEVAHLAATAADWALWDESYDFVQGRKPDYVDANILPSVFSNLNLAFFYFFDARGRLVFARSIDPATEAEARVAGFEPERLLPGDPLLAASSAQDVRAGLRPVDDGTLLVVSHPITDSLMEKAPAGVLIIGRMLNGPLRAELRDQTQVDFRLIPLPAAAGGPLAPIAERLQSGPAAARDYELVESSAETLRAYALLDDVSGRPALLLETAMARDIAAVGRHAIDLAIVLMVLAAILDLAVIWLLLQRLIIVPLRRLTRHIEAADRGGTPLPPKPLAWRRQDELGTLAAAYDRLNTALGEQVAVLNTAMAQLHAADAAKTSFFANMSHELRTPLNAIIGFSDLLRSEMFGSLPNQRYRDYIADINISGHHLLDLVNQILDFAKADSETTELASEPVDLRDCIDDTLRMVRLQAERAGVAVERQVDAGLPVLQGDRLRISQILLNLVSNAVKFTDAGGTVTVSALRDPRDGIELRIADTGIGMRPEDIPQALSPFVQLPNARSRAGRGTGLGLPLAKRLAELHGARFDMISESGRGTTVTITFPASSVAATAA